MELPVFSFCFVELTIVNPVPINRTPPVCPIMFGCTMNDPSIHHFSIPLLLALRISGRFLVPMIYFIRWINLAQSLLSGSLTLVARNEITVQVYGLPCLVENNIFATRWWNSTACFELIFLQSSLTLKVIVGASLELVPPLVGSVF